MKTAKKTVLFIKVEINIKFRLSKFSNILEKLFVQRLDNSIENHNVLSDHQCGFRANKSTSMSVMELVEEISTALDNKEYTVGVFIDFETIKHGLLKKELEVLEGQHTHGKEVILMIDISVERKKIR